MFASNLLQLPACARHTILLCRIFSHCRNHCSSLIFREKIKERTSNNKLTAKTKSNFDYKTTREKLAQHAYPPMINWQLKKPLRWLVVVVAKQPLNGRFTKVLCGIGKKLLFLDIDECRETPPPCVNAICFNTPGSFVCQCEEAGFSLDASERVCVG